MLSLVNVPYTQVPILCFSNLGLIQEVISTTPVYTYVGPVLITHLQEGGWLSLAVVIMQAWSMCCAKSRCPWHWARPVL